MKKFIPILIILTLFSSVVALAQDQKSDRLRKRYINLSFVNQKLEPSIGPELKSNYGAAFTVGKTYYLHKEPIGGMLRFGIDATWFDMNYTGYAIEFDSEEGGSNSVPSYRSYNNNNYDQDYDYDYDSDESDKINIHQLELAMQVGVSATITPIDRLNISGYFRVAPSFSVMYDTDLIRGSYATYFVTGGAISYGFIGIGAEYRFGNCRLNSLLDAEDTEGEGKTKFSGMRVYVSFRF